MVRLRLLSCLGLALLACAAGAPIAAAQNAVAPHFVAGHDAAAPVDVADTVTGALARGLSRGFVANAGQRPAESLFLWRGDGLEAHATIEGLRLRLADAHGTAAVFLEFDGTPAHAAREHDTHVHGACDDGAARATTVSGLDALPGAYNVYRGDGAYPAIERFGRLLYADVGPGLDVVVRPGHGGLEYDLLLAPGADLSGLVVRCAGVRDMALDDQGRLRLDTGRGVLLQDIPAAWQVGSEGERYPVDAEFRLIDGGSFGFSAADLDPALPLVVDPSLTYSSYLGGGAFDLALDVARGDDGTVYVTGRSASADFPVSAGAFDETVSGVSDAFVAAMDLDTGTIHYATFLGDDDMSALQGERGVGVAVDASGAAYVAGWANSAGFPTTTGAFQESPVGALDGFVAKLDPLGALVWSTRLGGSRDDQINDLALAAGGQPVVTGWTTSGVNAGDVAFPTTAGAYDESFNSTIVIFNDAFVTKVAADGASLTWSTFLGGLSRDEALGVAVAADDSVAVTGLTGSADFPATSGAFDESFNGATQSDQDAFVARFSAAGDALSWATFLGGVDDVEGRAVGVGADGAVFVAGVTTSSDLPASVGAFDETYNRGGPLGSDIFVGRLTSDGSALDWLTYLGGSDDDSVADLAVNDVGAVVVVGTSRSSDFPAGQTTVDDTLGGVHDALVAKLSSAGDKLLFASFWGGTGDDEAMGVALDEFGAAVVVGKTDSSDATLAGNAQEPIYQGDGDGFVARLDLPPFINLGFDKPGTGGLRPRQIPAGSLDPLTPGSLTLDNMLPGSAAVMFVGFQNNPVLFEGGFLVPFPFALLLVLPTGGGTLPLPWASWNPNLPTGFDIYVHTAVQDPGAAFNVAMTNALHLKTP